MSLASVSAWTQTQTLNIAGVSRNYILYAPSGLPTHPPLVFVIHGFNMTGQQEVSLTRMNAVADREKFVVVYPNALPNASNQQSWDLSGSNDYNFLLAIIDTVAKRHAVDRARVYASGFSQGGFMAYQLGCRYADVFAAIAPVSGTLNTATCSPKRPVPMIFTYGTNEGFDVNTFKQSGDKWAQLNECSGMPEEIKPYPASNANSVVTRTNYKTCKEGAEIAIQVVTGGTHEWPMNTQTKVNNSEEVWAFFKRFSLASATSIRGRGAQAHADGQTPESSPTRRRVHGRLTLPGSVAGARAKVFDHRGREVAKEGVSR